MKKIAKKTIGDGMDVLLGQRVTLFCMNYIYTGTLIGVNETCVLLTEASIVYETGGLTDTKWKDAQALPHDWHICRSAIESFGVLK